MTTADERIPMLDLRPEIELLWEPLQQALADVLRSGQFILGPQVAAFEKEVAEFLGVRHAVSCNSGTDALVLALRGCEVGPGDEVITTPFTFFATAEAISIAGARPVFVDVDPATLNIDPAAVLKAITPRTRAILPVHLFGLPAKIGELQEIARAHNLLLIEDAAQAFGGSCCGCSLGAWGNSGAFSFFPSKNLGAFGDGGLVATDDDEIADRTRMLRSHGSRRRYENEFIGFNSRLDEIQAAVLRIKLPHVREWNEARRAVAGMYRVLLQDLDWLQLPQDTPAGEHVWHQYTLRVIGRDRDALRKHLDAAGIATMIYYPVPVHRMPVYDDSQPLLPVAEQAAREVVSLPIGPFLSDAHVDRIAAAIRQF